MPLLAQMRECLDDFVLVTQQVGKHHDQRSPPDG